jgi:hypothetical protein
MINFDLSWDLNEFRKYQPQSFDVDGKCYPGTPVSANLAETMLSLINRLESEVLSLESKIDLLEEFINWRS